MADQFAMEPGMGNFPGLLNDCASPMGELAAKLGPRGGCAMQKGDLDTLWELWDQIRESLKDNAAWLASLADGSAGAGGNLQASDGG